jgi:hypothetical protein
LLFAALLTLGMAGITHADDIYTLKSSSNLQKGSTLSGTIRTDGTIGILTPSNIISWNFTISKRKELSGWEFARLRRGGSLWLATM